MLSVAVAVGIGGFWHYMGNRELRNGLGGMRGSFTKMDDRFARMDRRFEGPMRQSSEGHAKILEAIRELGRQSSEEHLRILEAIRESIKR